MIFINIKTQQTLNHQKS